MPINFPDSPSSGDTHTIGDKTWTYDGTAWNVVTSSVSDHGNLGGLADDDHTQYALADGTRGTFEASGAVSTHEAAADPHNQYLLADGTRTATELTVSGDLTVDTDTLHVDSTNNRVGIGTTSPDRSLHVDSGGVGIAATFQSSLATGGISLMGSGTTDDTRVRIGAEGDDLKLFSNNVERVRIASSGNVGIGTDSPTAQLTVKAASTGVDDGTVEFHSWSGSASSPTEVEDWPTPVLALRAYDNFFAQQMLSFGYPNDAIYQTGGSVWSFRLESGYGATSSSSSTNLNLLGPGTFKVGNFNASGTKTFRIGHPLPELNETHDLLHNAVESPQADNLYRGGVTLVNGLAVVNLDEAAGMTEGTFVLLNRDIQCFISNKNGWTNVRGSVDGNVLTIEAQDSNCADTVSWMVIGERQDSEIKASPDTDEDGHLIVEPVTNRVTEAAIAESVARMEAARIEALESAP